MSIIDDVGGCDGGETDVESLRDMTCGVHHEALDERTSLSGTILPAGAAGEGTATLDSVWSAQVSEGVYVIPVIVVVALVFFIWWRYRHSLKSGKLGVAAGPVPRARSSKSECVTARIFDNRTAVGSKVVKTEHVGNGAPVNPATVVVEDDDHNINGVFRCSGAQKRQMTPGSSPGRGKQLQHGFSSADVSSHGDNRRTKQGPAQVGKVGNGSVARSDWFGEEVPDRYLRGCQGDPVEAARRWKLTLEWRAAERVNEVLREPQPHFDVIKRHYPHCIHRRSRTGCPVWMERRMDLAAIKRSGITVEELRRHYLFVTEYLWAVVEPDFDRGQTVTVLDVEGLGLRDLAGETVGFAKQAATIVQEHYVERSNRMVIINAPSYFSMFWKLAQPILNDRMKAKISIVDCDKKRVTAALLELIAPENLPKRYGGTCPLDMGESEEEVGMREYVASVTPSLAPPPTAAVTPVNTTTLVQGQQSHRVTPAKELVESMPAGESRPMELGGRGESSSLQQRKPAEPERVAVPHDAIPKASPGIVHRRLLSRKKKVGHDVGMAPRDQDEDTSSIVSRSSSHRPPRTRSPARRLLSRIGKGRKSGVRSRSDSDGGRDRARSASPSVAHLGEDDAAVYDGDLQQWVVPGEMGTLGRSGYAASDIGGESRSRRRGWRKWLSRRHGRGKRGLSADRGSSRDVHNLVVSSGSRELDASGSTDSS